MVSFAVGTLPETDESSQFEVVEKKSAIEPSGQKGKVTVAFKGPADQAVFALQGRIPADVAMRWAAKNGMPAMGIANMPQPYAVDVDGNNLVEQLVKTHTHGAIAGFQIAFELLARH